jgi:predicted AAA+ superfamily ATPase
MSDHQQQITKLLEAVSQWSPWQAAERKDWHLSDGSLIEIFEAKKLGLFEPPKKFFTLKERFFEKHLNNKKTFGIIVIRGPRRVGKTSTLKYLIKYLIDTGYDKKSFFYFSLDDEKLFQVIEKKKLLREFLGELIKRYEIVKPIILILDEVTFYRGWARVLKNLVDSGEISNGVAVIATGSYSLDLSTAKSELHGRHGPLGESLGGDVFFPPRRFIEVAESLLRGNFRKFIAYNFGLFGRRLGMLEFLAGFQTPEEIRLYDYEAKVNKLIDEFYDDLHGVLDIYKLSGGYPRAFFEAMVSQRNGQVKIEDARYRDDIFELLVADCRKFRLDERVLTNLLSHITRPSMVISSDYRTLGLGAIKKEDAEKYLNYLISSGLFMFIPSISSPAEVDGASQTVRPSSENLKLITADPAAFLAIYSGVRKIHSIYRKADSIIKGEVEDLLIEAIAISHIRHISAGSASQDIAFNLHKTSSGSIELSDAVTWYINHKNEFILIPIEVKNSNNINKDELEFKAKELRAKYGAKRLVVVTNAKRFEIQEYYVLIPIELFLILL